jgi:hypothetical protein
MGPIYKVLSGLAMESCASPYSVGAQSESGRQSCLEIDLFPGDGVVEFQKLGVQEISSIAGEAGKIFKRLAG